MTILCWDGNVWISMYRMRSINQMIWMNIASQGHGEDFQCIEYIIYVGESYLIDEKNKSGVIPIHINTYSTQVPMNTLEGFWYMISNWRSHTYVSPVTEQPITFQYCNLTRITNRLIFVLTCLFWFLLTFLMPVIPLFHAKIIINAEHFLM